MLGPCEVCGAVNYMLSFGGPTICPSCDCGNFGVNVVQRQGRELASLRATLAERDAEARKIPEGYALLPIKPTQAMVDAALEAEHDWRWVPDRHVRIELYWKVMLEEAARAALSDQPQHQGQSVALNVCDYPICSERGAGHPFACRCVSATAAVKPQHQGDGR